MSLKVRKIGKMTEQEGKGPVVESDGIIDVQITGLPFTIQFPFTFDGRSIEADPNSVTALLDAIRDEFMVTGHYRDFGCFSVDIEFLLEYDAEQIAKRITELAFEHLRFEGLSDDGKAKNIQFIESCYKKGTE